MKPTLKEFIEHGNRRLLDLGENPQRYQKSLKAKYLAWSDNDWKTLNNRKIKNWKSTLTNTLPYLKAEKIDDSKLIEVDFKKYG